MNDLCYNLEEHELEPVDFRDREILWECRACPHYEFSFQEMD